MKVVEIASESAWALQQANWLLITAATKVRMIMHGANMGYPELAATVAPMIHPLHAEISRAKGYEDPVQPWTHVAAVAAAMVLAASRGAQ